VNLQRLRTSDVAITKHNASISTFLYIVRSFYIRPYYHTRGSFVDEWKIAANVGVSSRMQFEKGRDANNNNNNNNNNMQTTTIFF